MTRHAAQDGQIGQNIDHVDGFELPIDTDHLAFMSELLDHFQLSVFSSFIGAILDSVAAREMVGVLGTPDARSVNGPETTALGLLLRHK
jgi:hypothetical protein